MGRCSTFLWRELRMAVPHPVQKSRGESPQNDQINVLRTGAQGSRALSETAQAASCLEDR